MAAQPPSVGTLTKFVLDTANPPLKSFEYLSFNLGKRGSVLSSDGIRGTRSHPVERTRTGVLAVSGTILTQPGQSDLDTFLPLILGQNSTGAGTQNNPFIWTPSDRLNAYTGYSEAGPPFIPNSFLVGIDRIAQAHLFKGCQIDRATFRAVQGGILELELAIEGLTETVGTVTNVLGAGFPALVSSLQPPYVLMDSSLSYFGTVYQYRQFELVVDNALKKDRWMNNIVRTDLPALDRVVTLTLSLPYTSDQTSIYDTGVTSGAVTITFQLGGGTTAQLQFQLPAFQAPAIPPETPGRDEVLLPLVGIARKTGITPEITITNFP